MSAEDIRPTERIAAAFASLTESAKSVNQASGELARPISSLEASLQRLNTGVACWVKISSGGDPFGAYWSREVGYAMVRGAWGLAIREVEGGEHDPESEKEDLWRFNEAPHHLRVKAVDKLPELIEAMVEATNAAAKRLKEKAEPARDLAEAVLSLITVKKK